MICPYCGTRNRARAEFCRHCRALLRAPAQPSGRGRSSTRGAGVAVALLVAAIVAASFLLGRQVAGLAGAPGATPTLPPSTATAPAATHAAAGAVSTPMATHSGAGAASTPTATRSALAGSRAAPTPTGQAPGMTPGSPQPTAPAQATQPPPSPAAPPVQQPSRAAGSPGESRSGPLVAAQEARVRSAVIASNTAWMAALETASPAGLDAIKTGSSLQSTLNDVAILRQRGEHWQIRVRRVQVIWARLLSPTRAQALMRKVEESRALYRRGRRQPLEVDQGSYSNLYSLDLVGGHWLVSQVLGLDDATAARLAAAPPADLSSPRSAAARLTATASATTVGTATAAASLTERAVATATATTTATAAPTTTPTRTATTAPQGTPAGRSGAGPVAVVRAFYAALTARDYAAAYNLFTPRLQAQIPNRAAWATLFAQEEGITVAASRVVSQDARSATVALTIDTTWSTAPARRRFAGTWTLDYTTRGWRLDSPNLHRVSA